MANKMLGKYELLEELGRGGFGTVYHARDTSLDVERAVKILHPALVASPEFIERFRREAKIAARLDHPNIVPVYEFGEQEGAYYLTMKYMPGGSLKDVLVKAGRLPFERALQVTRQIAGALEYAYSQPEKLIHRDIKPGNILFEADNLTGKAGAARLADFGFAKALVGASSSSLSASGGMIGTPSYMAPEIWRQKEFTPATDVYSLACVFNEMVTGKVLFEGESPADIMTRHVLDGPQFPQEWPEGVPEGIEKVLGKALAREQKDRYQSVGEFVVALEHMLPSKDSIIQPEKTIPEAVPEAMVAALAESPEKTIEPQTSIQPADGHEALQAASQSEDARQDAAAEVLTKVDETLNRDELVEKKAIPSTVSEVLPPHVSTSRAEPGNRSKERRPTRKFPVWVIVGIVLVGIIAIVGIVSIISNPFSLNPQATLPAAAPVVTQAPVATQAAVVTQPPTAFATFPSEVIPTQVVANPTPTEPSGPPKWVIQNSGSKSYLNNIFFVDQQNGWAVGGVSDSSILHSQDGGRSWNIQNSPSSLSFESIYFVNQKIGFIVGGNYYLNKTSQGIILNTTDGGQNWSIALSTLYDIHSIHFVDAMNGWAVGEDYNEANEEGVGSTIILSTTDGGNNWETKDVSSKTKGLKAIFFLNHMNGWAVGQYGSILATNDGGRTWLPQISGTQAWLYSVYFTDAQNGWIAGDCFYCGDYGVVLSTKDGGKSWMSQHIQAKDLRSLYFINSQEGWTVGSNEIFHTTNGGSSWDLISPTSSERLNSVFFIDSNHGWVSGDNGTILKYAPSD